MPIVAQNYTYSQWKATRRIEIVNIHPENALKNQGHDKRDNNW